MEVSAKGTSTKYPSKRAALFTQQNEERGTKTLRVCSHERAVPSRVCTSKKGTQLTH
jgi:hypothetical protein